MNLKSRTYLKKVGGSALMAAGVLAAIRGKGAQSVLMGPPPTSTLPAAQQEDSTNNAMSVFMPSYDNRDNSLPQPLKFGPVVLRPHPYYHFMYATGLQSSTNNAQRSIIQELSPGVAIDLGRHWMVDYTPTIRFYSNRAFKNSVDQSASLTGGTHYDDWVFNLSQTFNQTDSELVETATQTKQQAYATTFSALYQINDKMYEESDLSQNFNFVQGLQDSRSWSGMEWLNYEFNKRLIIGIGAGGSYANIESETAGPSNPDQATEQVNARLQWRATDKLSLSLTAGAEENEFLAEGYKNELNPTFGASIEYQPFKHTDLSLSASQTVQPSDFYTAAESVTATSISLQLSQRVLVDYFLTVGLGYTKTDYDSTQIIALPSPPYPAGSVGILNNVRSDDVYNFNVRVGRNFLKRGNMAVTYQYSEDRSSATGFSYSSSQIGFEIGFTY